MPLRAELGSPRRTGQCPTPTPTHQGSVAPRHTRRQARVQASSSPTQGGRTAARASFVSSFLVSPELRSRRPRLHQSASPNLTRWVKRSADAIAIDAHDGSHTQYRATSPGSVELNDLVGAAAALPARRGSQVWWLVPRKGRQPSSLSDRLVANSELALSLVVKVVAELKRDVIHDRPWCGNDTRRPKAT